LNNRQAICVPFTNADRSRYWENPEDEVRIWRAAARIYASKIPKIGQNYLTYDDYYNESWGMPIVNFWGDTRYMHKTYQPELPSSLQALTSTYTYPRQNFYKEEGKADHPTFTEAQFRQYNCLDTLTASQIAFKIRDKLVELNLWDTYVTNYLLLGKHLLHMCLKGLPWNRALSNELDTFYTWMISELQTHVKGLTGRELNVNSPQQMARYFYGNPLKDPKNAGALNLAPQYDGHGEDRHVTCNYEALLRLRKLYPRCAPIIEPVIKLVKAKKRKADLICARVDSDEYIRDSLAMGAETLRLTSASNSFGTGRNLQNIERPDPDDANNKVLNMRDLIMAPPGHLILEGDYRQIEAMVVAWLGNIENMIQEFLTGSDVHTSLAYAIFRLQNPGLLIANVTKRQRYLGKKGRHGSNYNMGPVTLATNIFKDTEGEIDLKRSESEMILNTIHTLYPGIRKNYHAWVREQLDASMTLWSPPPFNFRRQFWGRYKDEATYREGFAQIPQSIPPSLTNRAIRILSSDGYDVRHQIHDAAFAFINQQNAVRTFLAMKKAMTFTFNFRENNYCPVASEIPLTVPIDFSVGKTYGHLRELKKMSDEEICEVLSGGGKGGIDWSQAWV
jgi:DNA polymerase I-like protein with 3'-5' exonuclease and polymerase domains